MAESQRNSLTLYLHFPCFDGVISAVLASEYLSRKRGWITGSIVPVNYDPKRSWAATPLNQPAVVVDFQYHPQAVFWADHHQTSFATEALKADFEHRKSPDLLFDAEASSCAEVLWRKTYRSRDFERWLNGLAASTALATDPSKRQSSGMLLHCELTPHSYKINLQDIVSSWLPRF
jgi:hypothetical protein